MSETNAQRILPEVDNIAEGQTYAHRFLDATRRFANRPALRWKQDGAWQDLSYQGLERRVIACAAGLGDRGLNAGDRLAIWLENRWEWIVADLATQLLGAITTTVYHTLNPAQALALLRDANAQSILSNQARLEGMTRVGEIPTAELLTLSVDDDAIGQSFGELIQQGTQAIEERPDIAERLRLPTVKPDDVSALFYTSGTTGEPKGAMLTHSNIVFNAARTIRQLLPTGGLDLPDGERIALLHLPLAHVMGRNTTVPATLLSGGVLAIAEPEREKIPGNLVEVAPTVFPTVPHLLDKFMERAMQAVEAKGFVMRNLAKWALRHCRAKRLAVMADGGAVQSVRLGPVGTLLDRVVLSKIRDKLGGRIDFLVTGGANSNRRSVEFFWGIGIHVFEGYGATELTGTAAITWPAAMKLGTVGPAVPGVDIRLADDGEVLVRGPIVMKGYWQRPDATAAVIDADGWYHTGDVGKLDNGGFLTIVDRKREIMVLKTGKNIAPQAIENLLNRTPLIRNVCALGHDCRFVTALIVPDLDAVSQRLRLEQPATIDEPQVADVLRKELKGLMSDLSDFERVKRLRLISQPFTPESGLVTPTLKLLRRKIAEQFADEIADLYVDVPLHAISVEYDR